MSDSCVVRTGGKFWTFLTTVFVDEFVLVEPRSGRRVTWFVLFSGIEGFEMILGFGEINGFGEMGGFGDTVGFAEAGAWLPS